MRQDLLRELSIDVSLRTVERAVAPFRRLLTAEAKATVRFETPPGRQLQELACARSDRFERRRHLMQDWGDYLGRLCGKVVLMRRWTAAIDVRDCRPAGRRRVAPQVEIGL